MGYLVGSQLDECLNVGFANVGIAFLRQVNITHLYKMFDKSKKAVTANSLTQHHKKFQNHQKFLHIINCVYK